LEEAATAKATRSAERENYMLNLMTDASQDMTGALPFFPLNQIIFPCSTAYYVAHLFHHRFLFRYCRQRTNGKLAS
jgi:hypothetical protein